MNNEPINVHELIGNCYEIDGDYPSRSMAETWDDIKNSEQESWYNGKEVVYRTTDVAELEPRDRILLLIADRLTAMYQVQYAQAWILQEVANHVLGLSDTIEGHTK